ncbi:MFS transporter [Jatrophihabitans sp. GAS493]|uniref:MFS transporter n=1 Tax=Jatrophihabitans sp. GAS493 TaxID=1907575 RepID=UPI0018D513D9|nr:MFS transporter [Jatrophihabitans sp. GAS493]
MSHRGHLRAAFQRPGFQRLLTTRLSAQIGDGVFQASLAGAVLFNPDRATTPRDVAAGFAVILLPYSFVGPFAGVLLDRWWRQRVLVFANVVRALCIVGVAAEIASDVHGQPFFASALVVISVNRFFLSALSASLPHVVDDAELITGNAFSTTAGAIATTVGGGAAIGVRHWIGDTNGAYAVVAVAATVPYLMSALAAHGFERTALGPDDVQRSARETPRMVLAGLVAGARHIASHPPVARALTMIGVQRFCYGITTICTLLLYRNYFTDDGFFRAGITGLAQVVAATALGGGLAAVVTPVAARHLGYVRWPAALLFFGGALQLVFGLPFTMPMLLIAAFGLGFVAQGVKICVDTLVQQQVSDEFRGRVFSLYDTLFNLTFVSATVVTAILLPANGHSPAAVIVIGLAYFLTALLYLRSADRAAQDGRDVTIASQPDLVPDS